MSNFRESGKGAFTAEISGDRFRRDVQVAALAGHSLVEGSVRWLASLDDTTVEQECRDGMVQQLSLAMGVSADIGDRAFALCKKNLGFDEGTETRV